MLASLLSSVLAWLMVFHFAGPIPQDLGVDQGHLRACAQPQHCAQLRLTSADPAGLFTALRQSLDAMPRTQRLSATETYVHVVATSVVFGFADDVELALDQRSGAVELRSESRLGESDFGVNRQRLNGLQEQVREFLA